MRFEREQLNSFFPVCPFNVHKSKEYPMNMEEFMKFTYNWVRQSEMYRLLKVSLGAMAYS